MPTKPVVLLRRSGFAERSTPRRLPVAAILGRRAICMTRSGCSAALEAFVDASKCPHCGTALPAVGDAFCLICGKALDDSPEIVAPVTDRPPDRGGGVNRLARRLRVAGWVLIVWGWLGAGVGFVFGRPYVLAFYALVLLMGWQAVRSGSALRATAAAGREAVEIVGSAYVRQSWLVVAWLVLQIATAAYLAWLAG